MKSITHNWLIILFAICCFNISKSQCSLFYFFTNNYDCVTNLSNTSFTINGAVAPYTCTFVNTVNNATIAIGVTIGSTGTVTSMPVGNFNVFISSANNCTVSTSFQVAVPFSSSNVVFTNSNVSCFGGSNGSSYANVNNNFFIPPFTYTWSTGSTASTAAGLLANTPYSVTITDSQGCKVTNSVVVTEPPIISSTLTNTFIPCFGTSISSGFNTSGGSPGFSYTVDGSPSLGNLANNLFAGTHTILTKDNNGCLQTNTVSINQVNQPNLIFTITKPSCPGKSDGSISSSISGAPAPYTYTWQPVVSNLPSLSNIPVGNYTLTVKDASACITKSVALVLPAASMSVSLLSKPENCSAADGAATLNVIGGNFPYSYTTQPIVGAHTNNTLNMLSSGGYTTIIKDGNNCVDTLKFNIGNLSTVSLSIVSFTPELCYNQCNASIQLSVQNAVAPITYSVSNTSTITSSSLISNLCTGFYIIKAIDGIGCPATTTINFPSPPVFSYSASAPNSVCFAQSIQMQATASGGAGGYTYIWNPGSLSGQTVSTTPSGPTVYSLNVFDANGCTLAPFQLTVNVNAPISINISTLTSGICPGTTTQITPTVTGGDGNYTYNWLPGQINSASIFVQNASTPVYTLIVEDGCGSPTVTKIIPINLFPATKPLFTVSDSVGCEPLCISFNNVTPKSTNAIWNYGDKPFELPGNTTNYCYTKFGTYDIKLTVNDSNNCRTSATFSNIIKVLSKPEADFTSIPEIITLNNSENVLIKNISSDALTFTWTVNWIYAGISKDLNYSFNDTGCVFIGLIAKNKNNCYDTTSKFICAIEGFNFYMPNCITANDDNLNEVLIPRGTGWLTNNYLFEVYNRWGARIFKSTDFLQGWDAKVDEKNLDPIGVYYWRVNVTDNLEVIHEFKGHITIIR